MVSPDDVEAAITPKTILMSFMYANNEVGTINPIVDIAAVAAKHGVLFHSDAVQGSWAAPLKYGDTRLRSRVFDST